MNIRGFFEIGIYHPKTSYNLGSLWRSAYQLGAAGIFTICNRYKRQITDTLKTTSHIPYRHYECFESFYSAIPYDCQLVGIEMNGTTLSTFKHPERAIYLLGAEDHGLPDKLISCCHNLISIESIRTNSFNVAIAGALVMYDRMRKKL